MRTILFSSFRVFWLSLVVIGCSLPLRAEQFGLFTYQVVGGSTVDITDYPENAVGPVEIPSQIDGMPVTSIGHSAFSRCTGLTSVTIPASVTNIGGAAFYGCTSLMSVTIPASLTSIGGQTFSGCTRLSSVTIPAGVTSIGGEAFRDCAGLTRITIPEGVTSIDYWTFYGCSGLASVTIPSSVITISREAFFGCTGLTGVTLPSNVTYIGHYAFVGCTGLTSVTIPSSVTSTGYGVFDGCTVLTAAVFLGHAPSLGGSVFEITAPGFTSYYLSGSSGFTSPTWEGYPSTMIDEATYPAASWLLAHGLWYDTNLHQDPDGDGVNLLMGYALDLDPRLNLQGSLPVPVLDSGTLSLTFHATSPGIIYRAETSTDLTTWTTASVTQSAPAADGRSTASVLRDVPNRFLRLVVED